MNEGRDDDNIINIDQEAESMKERMLENPRLLNNLAGRSSCCIFRVPQSLVEINKEAYQPRIISIGPYHHGKEDLEMIQEHKWRFLKEFLERTVSKTNKTLDYYLRIVASMEVEIRESYSELIDCYDTSDLVKMMVLDGFFIIELFQKIGGLAILSEEDPIFTMAWVLPFLMRDLLRLENQIPFFVLQRLFDESKASREDSESSLQMLALGFFNYSVGRPNEVLERYKNLKGKHILDLFRKSFSIKKDQANSRDKKVRKNVVASPFLKLIHPATKLRVAGVVFKANPNADTFLDIKFLQGKLEIPHITIDDFTSSFFLNCVAFEQCYLYCSKDITTYVTFMRCLINTPSDAGFLCDHKIIENYFGTDEEIARFFNNVGKDVAFDIKNNYLSRLFQDVNEYYMNDWHVGWAGFKHTYFDTPWSFISALAAVMLLSFTVIQVFFAAYSYFRPPSQPK